MAEIVREYAVLHVDDSLNDQLLLQEAARLAQSRLIFIPIATFGSAVAYLGGAGAFSQREEFPTPDLLLLDFKLDAAETGLDLIRWVRTRPELRSVPVVMYSGSASQEQILACYRAGADHFLVKSSEFQRVVPIIPALQQMLQSNPPCSVLLQRLPEYRPRGELLIPPTLPAVPAYMPPASLGTASGK